METVDTILVESSASLSNKIAVITGAGGAICSVVATALANLGVKVVLLDMNKRAVETVCETITALGGETLGIAADVLDAVELEEAYRQVEQKWGAPDFLINGAGGNRETASTQVEYIDTSREGWQKEHHFLQLDLKAFDETVRLNLLGTVLPTQVFSRGMIEKGRGAIVNFASMSGFVPLTKVPAYSAAKAAVANFTKWLAVHYAHTGVRVNAIAPGFVMSEQLKFLHIDPHTGSYTDRARKVVAHTPLQRYAQPEELIGVIVWLLSDAARFVTGDVIPIDGGFSSYTI